MDLQKVIDNLDNTIAGKEAFKDSLENDGSRDFKILNKMFELNLKELRDIRADLLLVQIASEAKTAKESWKGDVDRQGGSFTQDEIDNSTKWG